MAALRLITFLLIFCSTDLLGQFKDPEVLNVPSIFKLNGEIDSIKSKVNHCDLPHYLNKCSDEVLWFDNNILIKQKYIDNLGRVLTKSFSYDKNNNLIDGVTNDEKGEVERMIFKYNSANVIVEIKCLKENNIFFISRSEYKANKRVKQTILDENEKPQNIFSYKYGTNGELIEETEEIPSLDYGTAGYNNRKYFYDKNDLLIKELTYEKGSKLVSTAKYYYNEKNQLIKLEHLGAVNNHYDSKTEYKYKDDYVIEVLYTNNQSELNEVKKYEYEFDHHKNLTRTIIRKDNNLFFDVMYVITYK